VPAGGIKDLSAEIALSSLTAQPIPTLDARALALLALLLAGMGALARRRAA
jgi:hypothetical protein